MPRVRTAQIGAEGAGQRVDNYLSRELKGVPRTHIYRIVRSGEVRVNGRRIDPSHKLAEGDRVRIPPVVVEARPARARAPVVAIPVLHEDEWLLALDKPAGLAVHGGSGVAFGLIERLRATRPEARFLELVHRIDRETSGVLLVAKKRVALVALHQALREGSTNKRYLVLVRGAWPARRQDVRLALRKRITAGGERRVSVDDADGQAAHTVFRRQRVWKDAEFPMSLVEAELKTGRTHQIRVHLAHLGFPIAGDDKYGDFDWNRLLATGGLKRMFLHAARFEFTHPEHGTKLRIESPLPPELAKFLERLDAGRR